MISNVIDKSSNKIIRRIVVENHNEESKIEFENYCKQSLNEVSDNLEIKSKYANLFENGKFFNEKSLKESKNKANENYFQINHIIKLDENTLPSDLEYTHKIL